MSTHIIVRTTHVNMKIINKTFLINLGDKHSIKDTHAEFKNTGLKLVDWKVNGVSDEFVHINATCLCNSLCSNASINSWIAHYGIWQYILKNRLDKVLILEDKIVPTKDFKQKLKAYWKEVPLDWDVVLLGCGGTCETSSVTNTLAKYLLNTQNTPVYNNNNKKTNNTNKTNTTPKISDHIFRPGFPIGLYAYVVSYKGAKKLLNTPELEKIGLNLEYTFAKTVASRHSGLNVYAFYPPLVYQNFDRSSSNTLSVHELFDPLTNKVDLSSQTNLQTFLNKKVMNYRALNVDVTNFSILVILLSFIVGVVFGEDVAPLFIIILLGLEMFEIAYTRPSSRKNKSLILEFLLALTLFLVGAKLRGFVVRDGSG